MMLALAGSGCNHARNHPEAQASKTGAVNTALRGTVRIDGSSTVYPITEAVAEEFQKVQPQVRVTVGISGTGGGFKKFTVGETDISDASRVITPGETTKAAQHQIKFIELPIGFDGIAVVVNHDNDFVSSITLAELKRIWQPESTVTKWSDVREGWPDREIHLYGPGTDSGTFDYFTEVVMGKAKSSRSNYMASEDDNVLVQGIAGDRDALGYFGFAYYLENKSRLKIVAVGDGNQAVIPTPNTIASGTYPISRPIFIYVSTKSIDRPEVAAFVDFYIKHAKQLVSEVGYVSFPAAAYEAVLSRFTKRKTGSMMATAPEGQNSVLELLGSDE